MRGEVGGGEYDGLVYCGREGEGKKVGNGLKGWKIEKCVGVEGIEKGLGYCREKVGGEDVSI